MAMFFGDKQRFAAEVGDSTGGDIRIRRVDLWSAGRWWTCDDNLAYVPQFFADVQHSLGWLRSGSDLSPPYPEMDAVKTHQKLLEIDDGSREQFWFPLWGPTTDNITAHVFRIEDRLIIPFEFWRPGHRDPEELWRVFVAELPEAEMIFVLEQMLAALSVGLDP